MSNQSMKKSKNEGSNARRKPGLISAVAVYFFFLSAVARTFTEAGESEDVNLILIQLAFFVIFMTVVLWVSKLPAWFIHILLVAQVLLTISIQNLTPDDDFANILFVLIAFQVALIFQGRVLAIWIIFLLPLTCLSLAYSMGGLEGVSKSFSNIAGQVSIFAYFIALREIDSAKERQRLSVGELKIIHAQLEEYAGQVEELAAIEERNRLARELHDSVSQTLFSISLNIRSTQILYKKNPTLLHQSLENLGILTDNALAQIRSLITQMRPQAM
jgi:signal transduction histidine kinase